ncbi:1-deoxy-D-xylulose-5-phosphate reductoisomerase [Candidatus Bandiella euplotis]|uniref:1-deoxy-D-xylulose 5-phosphate reductoisomerase n=1 Tax=Candidatus Bandiella euplotis TaxID=1664265 RepID=A0ABZ0UJE1_9RICK|nr:1-deoxy-D-xylulose-5-phosphate reductoisomerase [Candidatus Bandiella woodruffii]WPX96218.1 1-deoxy-D-xylulose 5-phosphate reductoisomerase [Candidatus Bandiella woodruffii]
MKKKVCILGSTGSIGCSALNLISQHRDKYDVLTITANDNVRKLAQQAIEFQVKNVVICNEDKYAALKMLLSSYDINVYGGETDLNSLASMEYDVAIVGISGIAALMPIMSTLKNSKIVGLANKESIICAGDFIIEEARKKGTHLIPLDSEHNAIFQVFENNNRKHIEKLVLTASGGPFLNKSLDEMKNVTPEEAIKHPNWKMGSKISVDCANMMNKGLEVIEACKLFDLDIEKVEAIIHPESLIHGMVHYSDGSILAQMGYHDMRTPISTALDYPKRTEFSHHRLDLAKIGSFTFKEIDAKRFPLFYLTKQAYAMGNCALIVLNIANEVAVKAYLERKIGFLDINKIIENALQKIEQTQISSVEDVINYSETYALYCSKISL